MSRRAFTTTTARAGNGQVLVRVPFDPDIVWGSKPRHHIAGTVDHLPVRGLVTPAGDGFGFTLGPAWLRAHALVVGDIVSVDIAPEGPQRADLAADIAAALDANPPAAAFFDSLAQFYRRAHLRWIDGAGRVPERRRQRVAETMHLLDAGHKQRPPSARVASGPSADRD